MAKYLLLVSILLLQLLNVRGDDDLEVYDDNDDDLLSDEEAAEEASNYAKRPGSILVDDDEIYFDDDEFEGFSKPTKHSRSRPTEKARNKSQDKNGQYQNYPETAAGIFIVLYLINFFIGQRTNERIARQWMEAHAAVFDSQFCQLGLDDSPALLIKDSQSCFKFYASGRRYCHSLLATLELVKRHDIFSLLLSLVDLSTKQDEVVVEIPMDEDMEPFIFAIMKKKHEKRIKKADKNLREHARYKLTSKRLPSDLVAWTDCPELEAAFLCDDKVVRTLEKYGDLLVSLHITDEGSVNFSTSTKIIRCKFLIPDLKDMEQCRTLIMMVMHFIDLTATYRLSAQARVKALKDRKKWADQEYRASHSQRQEASVQRKEEMKRREEIAAAEAADSSSRRKDSSRNGKLGKRSPRVKVIR